MQIMLWIMFAVLCISGITFAIIKTHAGMKSFISAKGTWTLAYTNAKHSLDNYVESQNPDDFEKYNVFINKCKAFRTGRQHFDQGDFQSGISQLKLSGFHPSNIPHILFLYRYFAWIPEVNEIKTIWSLANQQVYEFDATAELLHKAILNNASQHLIDAQINKANMLYEKVQPLETQLETSIHKLTNWVGFWSFWITALIYILMGLMLYLGIKRTMNAFHERDALYRATFHHSSTGIIQFDIKGNIQRMNQALCDIFSISASDLKGRNARDVLIKHKNQPPEEKALKNDLTKESPTISYHFKITNRKGQLMWLKATITKIFNQQNKPLYYIAMIDDITELQGINAKLEEMAHHDYLTGLANKFSFDQTLSDAVKQGKEGTLFCMDLDKFKLINDTAGHAAGDQALIEVAQILRLCFKKGDSIARIGGDEFAAFVSNINVTSAHNIKQGINKAIEQHLFTYKGQTFHLGISIGLAHLNEDTLSSKQLMLQADTAAYEAKSNKNIT